MKRTVLIVLLTCLLVVSAWVTVWWTPSSHTFISATSVDRTGDTIHVIIGTRYSTYYFGEESIQERTSYLLDYSLKTGQLSLYGPLGELDKYYKFAITPEHVVVRERNYYNDAIDKNACTYSTLALAHKPYRWLPEKACSEGDETFGMSAVPSRDRSGNFHHAHRAWHWNDDEIWEQPLVEINEDLGFLRPAAGGEFYRVLNANGALVAEVKSVTDEEHKRIYAMSTTNGLYDDAPLNHLSFTTDNKVLGFLPTGELLMAFDVVWKSNGYVFLVTWNLQDNTSQVLEKIAYEDLFSIMIFDYRKLPWWKKLKHFPFKRTHTLGPVNPVHQSE